MGANFPPRSTKFQSREIGLSAIIFVVLPMLFAHLTTVGLGYVERSVVVIESAVRNVGVALVLARALLSPAELAIGASFLIGHFLNELIIMISYATLVQRENASQIAGQRRDGIGAQTNSLAVVPLHRRILSQVFNPVELRIAPRSPQKSVHAPTLLPCAGMVAKFQSSRRPVSNLTTRRRAQP